MLKYKKIWHGIKPIRWLNKFNLTVLEGVRPPTDGKILSRLHPLSMISLQASKSHSSKEPKSESSPHATSSGYGSATPVHTETASPITPEL